MGGLYYLQFLSREMINTKRQKIRMVVITRKWDFDACHREGNKKSKGAVGSRIMPGCHCPNSFILKAL